jgi:hypothetical protein
MEAAIDDLCLPKLKGLLHRYKRVDEGMCAMGEFDK